MLSFHLGPLALPVLPLLGLAAVWAASWAAEWGVRRAQRGMPQPDAQAPVRAGNAVWWAVLWGVLAARAVQVALQADLYLTGDLPARLWAVVDLRDAGLHLPTGVAVAAGVLAATLRRQPAWRRPVGAAVLGSALLAGAVAAVLGVGQVPPLPALTLHTLAGEPRPFGPAGGRPQVVNLWASWCGPCRAEMPLLAAAQRDHPGVDFVFVNQGESASAIQAYLTDQDLPLRGVLLDPSARLGPAVGSAGLPTTLFLDAQGRVVARHVGVLNRVALQARLRELGAAP